jgi:hypothetical protein
VSKLLQRKRTKKDEDLGKGKTWNKVKTWIVATV